ncbi:ROK family protein [Planctomonas psychrotolerans]|uniref:ROK family protein n=1 Tax=Planctomonas psychrotolerans TaxID=2528712 RepID=UPI00123C6BCB|nr:ROK family protein [Planctomonas psychrotolerans]
MSAQYALAVDFGGTKVEAALVNATGQVLQGSRFRNPTGASSSSDELGERVLATAASALEMLPPDGVLDGIGIGCAGPITVREGLVSPLNVPAWRGFPLRDLVHTIAPDTPITLQMDGMCIALAEQWIGSARGSENVMGMIVSTGIGGGLILNGRTVAGPTGNAGHIGHVEVAGFDDPCACGGFGCVEAIASGPKTVAWAKKQGWSGSSGEELAVDYAAGDEIAVAAVQRSGSAIGQAIASATALVDLDIVAIGGGFIKVSPDIFNYIRAAIATRQQFDFVTKVQVVPSGLSADGPLVGAAALVHHKAMVPSF